MNGTEFDYVVVGAGSAGCVWPPACPGIRTFRLPARSRRSRLSSVRSMRRQASSRWCRPASTITPTRRSLQPGLNGRKGYQPRGKTLGGSSSINAMLYVAETAGLRSLGRLGNPGWGYEDVLPLFRRSENNEQFDNDFHGRGGPLNVTYPRYDSEVNARFLKRRRR